MYLNRLFSIALLSCSVWVQISTNTANSKPIIVNGWQALNRTNYSIKYPPKWELQEIKNTESGTSKSPISYLFFIFSPLESPADKFRENINLVTEDLGNKKVSPDLYQALAQVQLKTQMKNCKITESRKIQKGSRQYYKMIWTWDYETNNLKVEQYYWVLERKAYVLTFTSEENKFAQFQEVGENILNTFRLKP